MISVFSGAEALLLVACSPIVTAVLYSYFVYRTGGAVSPPIVLAVSLLSAAITAAAIRRVASWSRLDTIGLVVSVTMVLGWCFWIAQPDFLPAGGGPDITHHLVLINYIERAWQASNDPALVPYLGDMIYYTPGSHLLIALAGAWTGLDGLHAAHAVLASTVAIKAGFIYCISRRLFGRATPLAIAAPLLLFIPDQYFFGSFAADSFWAQVVSEMFACATWWAIVAWDENPSIAFMLIAGAAAAAAFVTWPIWIGPTTVALGAIVVFREMLAWRGKIAHAVAALAPIAVFAAIHMYGRLRWLAIAGTSGAVVSPSPSVIGWPFLLLAAAGFAVMARRRSGRATLALAAAIAVQALALLAVANTRGAQTPYMALKMMFLAIYPMAVAAALALESVVALIPARRRNPVTRVAVLVVAIYAGWHIVVKPRPRPILSESAYRAGVWAREHALPACVDYLVANGYTGYWLHLAVLNNPRNTARFEDPDTFEPAKALARWIEPHGLPFAIVDDMNGFSKALFSNVDVVARFGPSAVIKRRGRAICPAQS